MSKGILLSKKYGVNPTIPVCFLCGKPKNEIALLGTAYKDKEGHTAEAPMHLCIDKQPCDECKKMMNMGIMLISIRDGTDKENPYRTGNICVIRDEAAQRIFKEIPKGRAAFVEESVWNKLGLPMSQMEPEKPTEEKKNEGYVHTTHNNVG